MSALGRMTITIRTTKELHRWLMAQAKKNNRSLNQRIEWMLMQSREADEPSQLLDELRKFLADARKK
jgi:UDP-N-acetylglucosamine pyrophosphorylase